MSCPGQKIRLSGRSVPTIDHRHSNSISNLAQHVRAIWEHMATLDLKQMNRHSTLPPPPLFAHTKFRVPPYTAWDHPYTKWIINTFRSRANARLAAMSKEHPELFQHIFQIPDTPEKITCDSTDYDAMYKRSTVLYLRPLSLAVYMRSLDIIRLLLEHRLVDNAEVSYATDATGRSERDDEVELREIRPMTIAVRRNVLEALPVLFNSETQTLRASDPFTLRYANKWVEKCSKFRDILDYTISVVRRKRLLPMVRVFETLAFRCQGYCYANSPQTVGAKHKGRRCSLFQRLARYLLSEAGGNRLALPLIQSMNQLIFHRGFYKSPRGLEHAWPHMYSFSDISEKWESMPVALKDRLITLAFMFKVHEVLQEKAKTLPLSQTTRLISDMLRSIGCQSDVMTTSIFRLQQSTQFLLHCSLETSDENNTTEGGDMKPLKFPSSKALQHLKPPTKKALQFLLYSLRSIMPKGSLKPRANRASLLQPDSYENNVEHVSFQKTTKEARKTFTWIGPHPVEPEQSKITIFSLAPLNNDFSDSVTTHTVNSTSKLVQLDGKKDEEILRQNQYYYQHCKDATFLTKGQVSEILVETPRCDSSHDLIFIPPLEENSLNSCLILSTLPLEEASSPVVDNATGSTDRIGFESGNRTGEEEGRRNNCHEQRGVEIYITQRLSSVDDESIQSEKLVPKQWLREISHLVEVDNLIEKIANNAAITNEFLLSDDDSDLIDSMLKDCFNKSESETTPRIETSEGPGYDGSD